MKRSFCSIALALGVLALMLSLAPAPRRAAAQTPPESASPVTLNWLGNSPPPVAGGVSWGVPWPRGTVQKGQTFTLTALDGKPLPLQSWPLAYWPDGSIKWSGFATVADAKTSGTFKLAPAPQASVYSFAAASAPTTDTVKVTETADAITIDTGKLQCRLPRQGSNLIDSLKIAGREVARQGRLVCLLQNGAKTDVDSNPAIEKFQGTIKKITVEQSGPVRAVVKIEGLHKAEQGGREWLPFTVRFYFYAGQAPIRMVHTIVFDGDDMKDFIRGLGVAFAVPLREEIQNRHVRFGGEGDGLWSEPIEPLLGYQWRVSYPEGGDVYNDQVAGLRIPNRKQLYPDSQRTLDALAKWDDYRLVQPNAGGFTIEKRTNPASCWLPAGAGKRASGLVFAGDVSGGLAVGLKNFWQSYPTSLEVHHARSDAAELRVWMWSPDAPAMDLRHYDLAGHGLEADYEDVEPGLSTPDGVARTSELTLFPCAALPAKQESAAQAKAAAAPPLLVATPQYLHDQRAFGIWSLQDRSTPYKKAVEDQIDAIIAFYQKAIDQQNWYGFWDFGDVMHGYDAARHEWRYDVGGFAWDNSEQGTDMMLWYSFLRTGRADIFRMAEAMSRHTGEVDCYHVGPLAGLGSRHNVRHWGCGAKEARISMAPYRRFYYYLTTDERTGDVMHEMLQADSAVTRIDPMRHVAPPTAADKLQPARLRGGPDWFALVGNWMTEWERTGDTKWRDKITAGMDSIAAMPYWFHTSQYLLWYFDPATGKLTARDPNMGGYNLVTNMGGPEVIMELNGLIDNPTWQKVWLNYCKLSSAPAALIQKDKETGTEGATGQYGGGGRLSGYVYARTKNPAFARRAITGLPGGRGFQQLSQVTGAEAVHPIDEGPTGLITNNVNQSTLNTIEVLDLCADQLPKEAPAQNAGGRGGFGGGFGGRGARGGARGGAGARGTTPGRGGQ